METVGSINYFRKTVRELTKAQNDEKFHTVEGAAKIKQLNIEIEKNSIDLTNLKINVGLFKIQ